MNIANKRETLLLKLLMAPAEAQLTMRSLINFEWDFKGTPIVLTREHVTAALHLYLRGQLSEAQMEFWSNCIEGREDLSYEAGHQFRIESAMYELANPVLTQALQPRRGKQLLEQLAAN